MQLNCPILKSGMGKNPHRYLKLFMIKELHFSSLLLFSVNFLHLISYAWNKSRGPVSKIKKRTGSYSSKELGPWMAKLAMFGIYTQFGLSFKFSFNKNCTVPYFINLISNRANFAVRCPTSFDKWNVHTRDKVGVLQLRNEDNLYEQPLFLKKGF